MRQLLQCGGASGHLMHLHDDPGLSFAELKDVIRTAAEGRLERVTEKLDGMNLVFTWDGELRVARSGGDLRGGGLDAEALAEKFKDRGSVAEAFNGAFRVLHAALEALPPEERRRIFGGGSLWYSVEVIYAKNPNVINYDGNWIVFHDSPVFHAQGDGRIVRSSDAPGARLLGRWIDRMQRAITVRSWQVRGAAVVRMKKLSDGRFADAAIEAIEEAQNEAGVDDSATVGDYVLALVSQRAEMLDLPAATAAAVAARVAGSPGAPKLPDIKKTVDQAAYRRIAGFVQAGPELVRSAVAPLELAIHGFAVEVLRGVHSTLVGNPSAEVQRLRAAVARAIKASEGSPGSATLERQVRKLGPLDNISSSMEGIVFIYKGNAYKFTGSFAPMNQILGLLRYGRR